MLGLPPSAVSPLAVSLFNDVWGRGGRIVTALRVLTELTALLTSPVRDAQAGPNPTVTGNPERPGGRGSIRGCRTRRRGLGLMGISAGQGVVPIGRTAAGCSAPSSTPTMPA